MFDLTISCAEEILINSLAAQVFPGDLIQIIDISHKNLAIEISAFLSESRASVARWGQQGRAGRCAAGGARLGEFCPHGEGEGEQG